MSQLINVHTDTPEHYRVIDTSKNSAIESYNLSWGARGLHTYLITRGKNWKIFKVELLNRCPDGRDKIQRYINELKAEGFLEIKQHREKDGKFQTDWFVYRKSQKNKNRTAYGFTGCGEPYHGKPYYGEPDTVDQQLPYNHIPCSSLGIKEDSSIDDKPKSIKTKNHIPARGSRFRKQKEKPFEGAIPEDNTDATAASFAWWWRNVICLLYEKMTLPYPGELGENEVKKERIRNQKMASRVHGRRATCALRSIHRRQGYRSKLVISQLVRFAPPTEEIEAYGFTWKSKTLQADLVALAMGEYQGEQPDSPPGYSPLPNNVSLPGDEDLPF
jgi:hypothetical protein